jgi:hypothetical protein
MKLRIILFWIILVPFFIVSIPFIFLVGAVWELIKYILTLALGLFFILSLIIIYYSLVPIIPDPYKGWYFMDPPLLFLGSIVSKLPWWVYFAQPQKIIYRK